MGKHGAEAIVEVVGKGSDVHKGKLINILTHCNTGSLATAGHGTALGVVRTLAALGKLGHVYCTETRPYNQGKPLQHCLRPASPKFDHSSPQECLRLKCTDYLNPAFANLLANKFN